MQSRAKIRNLIAAVLCSGFLSGCMVGPKYRRPVVQTPNTFRDLAHNPQIQTQTASYADLHWWEVFKDPKLRELTGTIQTIPLERISAARTKPWKPNPARQRPSLILDWTSQPEFERAIEGRKRSSPSPIAEA